MEMKSPQIFKTLGYNLEILQDGGLAYTKVGTHFITKITFIKEFEDIRIEREYRLSKDKATSIHLSPEVLQAVYTQLLELGWVE